MSVVVPLRWLGAARTERIRALVLSRCQEWKRQWCARDLPLDLTPLSAVDAGVDETLRVWFGAHFPKGEAYAGIQGSDLEWLGCLLTGAAQADDRGLAKGVALRALKDLLGSLGPGAAAWVEHLPEAPAHTARADRHGAASFALTVDQLTLTLVFDAALCEILAPRATPPVAALSSRQGALGAAEVSLDAVLNLGVASLGDTLSLRVGDVVRTNAPLTTPIELRSAVGKTVFSGTLTESQGFRAIRFAGSSASTQSK